VGLHDASGFEHLLRYGYAPGDVLVLEARGGNATLELEVLGTDGSTRLPVRFPAAPATAAQFATAAVGIASLVGLPAARYRLRASAWTSNKVGVLHIQ
jgi:hypothetical protein